MKIELKETSETADQDFRTPSRDQQGTDSSSTDRKFVSLNVPVVLGIIFLMVASFWALQFSYYANWEWTGGDFPLPKFRAETPLEFLRWYGPIGLIYGWLGITTWLSTRLSFLLMRLTIVLVVVICSVFWIDAMSVRPIVDIAASVTMFVASVWGLIRFSDLRYFARPSEYLVQPSRQNQFSIRGVILLTTSLAVLFLMMKNTAIQGELPLGYFWIAYMAISLVNATVAVLAFRASNAGLSILDRAARLGASGLVAALATLAIAAANSVDQSVDLSESVLAFGSILIPFWLLICSFTVLVVVPSLNR